MLIILEGRARTGKTTLAKELVKRLEQLGKKAAIFKNKDRSENPAKAIIQQLLPLGIDDDTYWIVDRGHITEMVFSTYYERKVSYPPFALLWIDQCFASLFERALLVFLVADEAVLRRRHEETKREPEGDPDTLNLLFDQAVQVSAMESLKIDTGRFSPTEIVDVIISYKLGNREEDDKEQDSLWTGSFSVN